MFLKNIYICKCKYASFMQHYQFFSQVFEKLIFKQLDSYIEKQNILFQDQFGFRKGHLTAQAIAELTDTLRKAIDNNLYTCGIFWFSFDTVNHEILLNKLQSYGVRGLPLKWFNSYLRNRKQYTELGDYRITHANYDLWNSTAH